MGIGEACGIGSAAMCAKELGSRSSAFGLHWLGFGAKQCVEVELGALLIDSLHTLAGIRGSHRVGKSYTHFAAETTLF